jgi:hypothetical protein
MKRGSWRTNEPDVAAGQASLASNLPEVCSTGLRRELRPGKRDDPPDPPTRGVEGKDLGHIFIIDI